MKETHEEFMKRIIEESREPTLPERTHDALNVELSECNKYKY